jgi:large-conductance mechanosensitive channel
MNPIDQKKTQKTLDDTKKQIDWKEFFKNVVSFTIQLFILFILGSRIVIACKYAQASFLPTDSNCAPYTESQPVFDNETFEMNIDKVRIYNKDSDKTETYSKKIFFPFTKTTTTDYFIDKIREQSNAYNVSGFKMYVFEVLKSIFCLNYTLLNGLLNLLNWLQFESLIVVLGPLIFRLYLQTGIIISIVITIISFVLNLGWLFKKNLNNEEGSDADPNGPPRWAKISMDLFTEDDDFSFEILGIVLNFVLAWFLFWTVMFVPVHFIIFIICFITPFLKTPKISGSSEEKGKERDYTLWDSIRSVFETKLDVFMILVCLNIINSAHIYTNNTATVFVFIACAIFMYWCFRKPKSIPAHSTSEVANIDINGKTCTPPTIVLDEPSRPKSRKPKIDLDVEDVTPNITTAEEGNPETIDKTNKVVEQTPSSTENATSLKSEETVEPLKPAAEPVKPAAEPVKKEAQKGGSIMNINERKALLEKKIRSLRATLKHSKN